MLRHSLPTSLHSSHNHFIASFNYEGSTIVIEEASLPSNILRQQLGSTTLAHAFQIWPHLRVPQVDLEHLVAPFMEDEICGVVRVMQLDKAPTLDGFIGCFSQGFQLIIKHGLGRAFDALNSLGSRSFHHPNEALLILPLKGMSQRNLGITHQLVSSVVLASFSSSLIQQFGSFATKLGWTPSECLHK